MRWSLVTLVVGLVLVIAACGDEDEWISDDGGAATDPTPTGQPTEPASSESDDPVPTEQPTEPAVSETDDSGVVEPPIDASLERDPVDVVRDIAVDPESIDLELIYAMLPERFQVIEFAEHWVETVVRSFPTASIVDDPDHELTAKSYDGYALVRWTGHPAAQWVLIEQNGQWRFEPGDLQLIAAANQAERPGEGGSIGMEGLERESSIEPHNVTIPLLLIGPTATGVDADGMHVVMDFGKQPSRMPDPEVVVDSHLLTDTDFDLDSMHWSTGDDSGPVKVLRTTAQLSDNILTLPGWTDDDLETFAEHGEGPDLLPEKRHRTTLLLAGVPDDTEEVELVIDDVVVGPLDDEDAEIAGAEYVSHSFRYVFPYETTEPILIGEAPELGDPPTEADVPDAPDDQDLPAVPDLADLLEIESIETEQDGDVVDVEILIDAGDIRLEPAGQVVLVWDDGEETDAMIQFGPDGLSATGQREDAPADSEVVEIRIDQVTWRAEEEDEATIDQDSVRTSLGEFMVLNVGDRRIDIQPAGRRYIGSVAIEDDDGSMIEPSGSGSGFDENFAPTDSRVDFATDIDELVTDDPRRVIVEIWVAESGLVLPIDE